MPLALPFAPLLALRQSADAEHHNGRAELAAIIAPTPPYLLLAQSHLPWPHVGLGYPHRCDSVAGATAPLLPLRGHRGRRWHTWPGGCDPLLAGPRPGASEARRRQAPARVPRCSIATPPPPTSSLRPKPRASDGLLCFDSRGGLHATIRIKEGSYLQCYRLI